MGCASRGDGRVGDVGSVGVVVTNRLGKVTSAKVRYQ